MRAVVQALRAARRPARTLRGRGHASHHHTTNGAAPRLYALRRDRLLTHRHHALSSSMYFTRFSVALVSSLVASGAYFAYSGGSSQAGVGTDGVASPGAPLSAQSLSSGGGGGGTAVAYRGQPPSAASPELFSAPASAAAQATRKALVVEAGQLYTGTIVGDEPLAKSTDDHGRKVLEMMTPEQATQRLRRNQQSYRVGRGKGVVRYDVVQLASNDPIEDDHAEKIIEFAGQRSPPGAAGAAAAGAEDASTHDWMFWGVFDGHSGWTTSAKLRELLISYVARELNTTYRGDSAAPSAPSPPTASSIDAAIKRGFVALDASIVHDSVTRVLKSQSKAQAASLLAPALSGSCALLSFYDSASKTLRVACTGDSRAVLGRRSAADRSRWTAHPLSTDQTGGTESEAARLRAEHPGEPDVVRNGRVLGGLEPSRAFGDATYKWTRQVQDKIKSSFFGKTSSPLIRTPPYVTAEPVVTTTQLQPEGGDFVVMATDGLWEMLTNDEVVGLVGQWLEKHPQTGPGSSSSATGAAAPDARADGWLRSWFGGGGGKGKALPVQQADGGRDESGQRAPIRQQQWGLASSTSADNSVPNSTRFVVEDKNVATHLIRNALGGGDRDMVCALLTLPSPYSRRYRDDLTVEVIFFGEAAEDTSITTADRVAVNEDATADGDAEVKSKL